MIILQIPLTINANLVIKNVKKLIKVYLKENKQDYDKLKRLFKEEEILQAINSIQVIQGNIVIPTMGTDGKILRILEYGGYGLKANKLISRISRRLGGQENVI